MRSNCCVRCPSNQQHSSFASHHTKNQSNRRPPLQSATFSLMAKEWLHKITRMETSFLVIDRPAPPRVSQFRCWMPRGVSGFIEAQLRFLFSLLSSSMSTMSWLGLTDLRTILYYVPRRWRTTQNVSIKLYYINFTFSSSSYKFIQFIIKVILKLLKLKIILLFKMI